MWGSLCASGLKCVWVGVATEVADNLFLSSLLASGFGFPNHVSLMSVLCVCVCVSVFLYGLGLGVGWLGLGLGVQRSCGSLCFWNSLLASGFGFPNHVFFM